MATSLHKRGMKLIMDYVTNHWGTQHWMVKDPPTKDWIHYFKEYTNTNHRKEIHSDPYASIIDKKELLKGWFVPTMADLNQGQPKLLNYLIQNLVPYGTLNLLELTVLELIHFHTIILSQ